MNTKNIIDNKILQKCQAKNALTGEFMCSRKVWDDLEGRCISHCPQKPADEFKKRLLEELRSRSF